VITELKIKTNLIILVTTLCISSCSNSSQIKGAHWEGYLNFMHVTKEKMEMIYSVDVTGQKVFLDGYYEIIKKNTDVVIFNLIVEELEFGIRDDGRNFCRVWGQVDESEIQSYLYALDCLPIS
jgi:hypothetical protein